MLEEELNPGGIWTPTQSPCLSGCGEISTWLCPAQNSDLAWTASAQDPAVLQTSPVVMGIERAVLGMTREAAAYG